MATSQTWMVPSASRANRVPEDRCSLQQTMGDGKEQEAGDVQDQSAGQPRYWWAGAGVGGRQ